MKNLDVIMSIPLTPFSKGEFAQKIFICLKKYIIAQIYINNEKGDGYPHRKTKSDMKNLDVTMSIPLTPFAKGEFAQKIFICLKKHIIAQIYINNEKNEFGTLTSP